MFTEIRKQLAELDEKFIGWEDILLQQDTDSSEIQDTSETTSEIKKAFHSILNQVCNIIKEHNVEENVIQEVFVQRKIASLAYNAIDRKLVHYNSFAYLRKAERENPYNARLIFDLIWTQRILRMKKQDSFDPPFPMDEKTYKMMASELDAFTEFCVSRQMHIDSIYEQLKDISRLSQDLCMYISQTIDRDFEKLKLNYLINLQDRDHDLLMRIFKYLKIK
ncbi:MAG: hypothetical protein IKT52_07825 [Oscillospiraceae bacterium]|nr:hypothetical protein [Oscillospiraceae bacterium]